MIHKYFFTIALLASVAPTSAIAAEKENVYCKHGKLCNGSFGSEIFSDGVDYYLACQVVNQEKVTVAAKPISAKIDGSVISTEADYSCDTNLALEGVSYVMSCRWAPGSAAGNYGDINFSYTIDCNHQSN